MGHYNNILTVLSEALSKESFPRALDNICGAVARLISTSPTNVPVEQVRVFRQVLGKLYLSCVVPQYIGKAKVENY